MKIARTRTGYVTHAPFPMRSLSMAALVIGLIAMLPATALAQSPARGTVGLQPAAYAAGHMLFGSAVGVTQLADVTGAYVPARSANVTRHDPGVILWDEGSAPKPYVGPRLLSGSGSNQQIHSLSVGQ